MGGGFSSPSAIDMLQSFGSIPLLTALAQAEKLANFEALDDASVESLEPLLTLSPRAIYEHSNLLCSRVGTFHSTTYSFASHVRPTRHCFSLTSP